jgi:hypothetical protein
MIRTVENGGRVMSLALSLTLRSSLIAAAALTTSGCANETVGRGGVGQMMMLSGPATTTLASASAEAGSGTAAIADDISRKSFAAKVLASRALESVTGLKADPARLSEHD